MNSKVEYYYVDITSELMDVKVVLNDIMLGSNSFAGLSIWSIPLNILLMRKNSLKVLVIPKTETLSELYNINKKHTKITVKKYSQDALVAGPDLGEIVSVGQIDGIGEATLEFYNQIIDFNYLRRLPPLEDKQPILALGKQLIDLFEEKKWDMIWQLFKPKLRDYATAFYENEINYSSGFFDFLSSDFSPLGITSNNLEIEATPFLGKRIWRLHYINHRNLITSNLDNEGMEFTIDVYVCLMDKEYLVIR
jgi:hypothetical protein